MPLPEQEKVELFQKLCKETEKEIRDRHKRFGYRMWGWARNKWRQVAGGTAPTQAAAAAKGVGRVAAIALGDIVPIMPLVKLAYEKVVEYAQGNALASGAKYSRDPDEKLDYTREYMVLKGAEAVSDAIRKVDDVAAEIKAKSNYKTCDEFAQWLDAVLYYEYRLERLIYYNRLLQEFAVQLDSKLQRVQETWTQKKKDLDREGPKWWDDWQHHSMTCKETCFYPFDKEHLAKMPISAPYQVNFTPTQQAQLQKMGLQPIAPPVHRPLPATPQKSSRPLPPPPLRRP